MVVGRETSLPSGAIDLLALARAGEPLLIEFNTSPQNPDFRSVLAQLLDYGSDLWQMTLQGFENAVALRFFGSPHCKDAALKKAASLRDAVATIWPDMADEEEARLWDKVTAQLERGLFHYVAVA